MHELKELNQNTMFFPFFSGQRLIDKMVKLVETELNSIGAYKVNMPVLGPKRIWQKSGRWDNFHSEMFCVEDKVGQQFCLQPTQEETVTRLIAEQGKVFSLFL